MKLISAVFHPLLLITYLMILLYYLIPDIFSPVPKTEIPITILLTFVTTFIIPILSIAVMKSTQNFSSIELTKREERILPFISIAMFYGASTYMFIYKFNASPILSSIMISVTALIILLVLVTLRFKISVHSAAIWGACGTLTALLIFLEVQGLIYVLSTTFVISGMVSSSRLYLNYHTPTEIWSGSFLGFTFSFLMVFILAKIL